MLRWILYLYVHVQYNYIAQLNTATVPSSYRYNSPFLVSARSNLQVGLGFRVIYLILWYYPVYGAEKKNILLLFCVTICLWPFVVFKKIVQQQRGFDFHWLNLPKRTILFSGLWVFLLQVPVHDANASFLFGRTLKDTTGARLYSFLIVNVPWCVRPSPGIVLFYQYVVCGPRPKDAWRPKNI